MDFTIALQLLIWYYISVMIGTIILCNREHIALERLFFFEIIMDHSKSFVNFIIELEFSILWKFNINPIIT